MGGGHGGGITYKGVTVATPKTWHTVTGKGLCAAMWYISLPTPPPPSRLGASNSTPPTSCPSAARSNRRNGRIQATPSYTDEVPLSSEDGEGDGADDSALTFVWGTNISVQDVKSAIEMFVNISEKLKRVVMIYLEKGSIWL